MGGREWRRLESLLSCVSLFGVSRSLDDSELYGISSAGREGSARREKSDSSESDGGYHVEGVNAAYSRKSRVITWGNAAKLGIASAKNLEG